MTIYRHECRTCETIWDDEYSFDTYDWYKEQGENLRCPECGDQDTYRHVTTSACVVFKGAGWSPDGYSKDQAYEQLEKEGKKVKLYDRHEDIQRDMRGEKKEATIKRLKKEDELAKKYFGPDAALTQDKADKRVKAAVDKVQA